MRIGILSFQFSDNYGALLQGYALRQTLISLGYYAEIINYWPSESENTKVDLKSIIIKLITNLDSKKRKAKSNFFRKQYLGITTQKMGSTEELHNTASQYDALIVGSDQVWNCSLTRCDWNYLLQFENNNQKKFSYAASFGFEQIPEEYRKQYKKNLSEFNMISVREKQGKKIIKNLIGLDVPCLLDPTFLLDKKEWLKIAQIHENRNYILLYTMCKSELLLRFTDDLAKKTGFQVYWINGSIRTPLKAKTKKIHSASPNEFLGYFNNAAYVITNSFHGTAFSIIFEKQFFVECSEANFQVSSRIRSIIDSTGLENRYIKNIEDSINSTIDYQMVNKKIEENRKLSLQYLERIRDVI